MEQPLSQYQVLVELILRLARGQQLAPWTECSYFLDPRITSKNFSPGSNDLLAAQAPNRVGLIFSCTGSIWLYPGQPTNGNQGLALTAQAPTFELSVARHGILCQKEWWTNALGSSGSGSVTAIEILLREWPGAK